jgi:hypothetical protein
MTTLRRLFRSYSVDLTTMSTASPRGWPQGREAAGFLVSVAFVCLAAVRDVYLAGLFQRVSLLHVAVIAFTLCTLVLSGARPTACHPFGFPCMEPSAAIGYKAMWAPTVLQRS